MQLAGSGGATPYTWTIANGSQPLPAALSLAANGLLSGVPAASGTNSFIVRLTDHNGLTTTHSFSLVTNPKPQLSAAVRASGTQFQFLIVGAAGQNYTLQFATNLASGNWTSLFTTNNASTNAYVVADPSATNQQRYYRVLIGP
jgi:Mg-chelatase subunit ChlD